LLRLGSETYALPGPAVREVTRYRDPLPVPGAPSSLPGLISQRGAIVPVADLRPLLGLDVVPAGRATRLVLVQHDEILIALLADAVLDLADVPAESLEHLPAALDPTRARLLQAMATYEGRLVALLDLEQVIAALREG
jgi:purine-binding chemotaxis protein CheW